MKEYKVVRTTVRDCEELLNRLSDEGWRVIASTVLSGMSFTVNSAPMIVTLER